jgi:hypothetical protein
MPECSECSCIPHLTLQEIKQKVRIIGRRQKNIFRKTKLGENNQQIPHNV